MIKKLIVAILWIAVCLTISSCGKKTLSDGGLELRTYTYQNSNELVPPASLSLLENNRFSFGFSAQRSYIEFGSYSIDGDTILLTTDDGDFHYAFTITEDGLVFDAVNSSECIWYADFTDGVVFQ